MTRLATWLATCFGLGRFPVAPGTLTSAVATLCAVPLVLLGWKTALVAIAAATALGIPACGAYARAILVYDPADCVLDEVAGQWVSLFPVALVPADAHWGAFLFAFFAFRLFDIWKPWPVWRAERLPGGIGIVADDVMAGIYAAVLVLAGLHAGVL